MKRNAKIFIIKQHVNKVASIGNKIKKIYRHHIYNCL